MAVLSHSGSLQLYPACVGSYRVRREVVQKDGSTKVARSAEMHDLGLTVPLQTEPLPLGMLHSDNVTLVWEAVIYDHVSVQQSMDPQQQQVAHTLLFCICLFPWHESRQIQ